MGKPGQNKGAASKHSLSNEKRLESLKLKSQLNKLQQNIIKSALAEVDSGKSINKRIVFKSDDEEDPNDKISNSHLSQRCNEKDKRQLFTDSDSDSNENLSGKDIFNIKPQFEGRKGQELLALQARFKNDERFQLDERFLDNEEDEESDTKGDETVESMDINTEREKNFEILQEVLGFQFPTQSAEKKIEKYRTVKDTSRLRYDPTREDAENFEVKREPKEKTSSKKKMQKATHPEQVTLPEVSKKRFFQVAANLKDAFNDTSESKTFSFSKEFHNEISSDKEDNDNDTYFTEPISQLKHPSFQKSAFKYDSSDNEDETVLQLPSLKGLSEESKHQEHNNTEPGWKFFFSQDDPRLKEGVQYFKKSGTDEEIEEWWKKTRSAMLDLIQTKRKIYKHRTTVNRRGKRRK